MRRKNSCFAVQFSSGSRPEWLCISVCPVITPVLKMSSKRQRVPRSPSASETATKTRKSLDCQAPPPEKKPDTKFDHLKHRTVYDFCCFCGSVENIEHHNQFNFNPNMGYFDFCKSGTGCLGKYHRFVSSGYTDLSYGVPFAYSKVTPETQRKVPKRKAGTNGQLPDLTCDYCGKCGPDVMTNTSLPAKAYKHADFCKNKTCCRNYVVYVQNVTRIPHALCFVSRK
jgi:hypothetical protein